MSWQLWVLIAAAASGIAAVLLVKLSQAQEVFERIVEPNPHTGSGRAIRSRSDRSARSRSDRDTRPRSDRPETTVDDLIRYRRRQEPRLTWFPQPAHPQHRSRGHH